MIGAIRVKLIGVCWLLLGFGNLNAQSAKGWKAGTARVNITPTESMWMAGFAARTQPATGKLHDLWAKALVLSDQNGQQGVVVTMDLLGLPKGISDKVRDRLQQQFGLPRAQLILNSSHTHSGPVLENALVDIYPLDAEQQQKVVQYSRRLEEMLVQVVSEARKQLEDVQLWAENGVVRFQVNRRNNDANILTRLTELKGPNDYAVPVIKVEDKRKNLKAILFGYACHPTVLATNEWSGDYAGFAQIELEKAHPGAQAMFFQGAGADQNPLPRNTVARAKQYGRELAAAVDRVLEEDMRPLPPTLNMAYSEVALPLSAPLSETALAQFKTQTTVDYQKRWAGRMIAKWQKKEPFLQAYTYPVQAWHIGNQPVVALGGELVIGYANRIKQLFGQHTFVMGYSNDVMAYIPTATVLREGGYEGSESQMVYGLPAPWSPVVESSILQTVIEVAKKAQIPFP